MAARRRVAYGSARWARAGAVRIEAGVGQFSGPLLTRRTPAPYEHGFKVLRTLVQEGRCSAVAPV
eukprot:11222239-Lingulodinium_polyedra.AAC.1